MAEIPKDEEAEHALLGAMLTSSAAAETAVGLLEASDFFLPTSQETFAVIEALVAAGDKADPVVVADQLTAMNIAVTLQDLLSWVASPANTGNVRGTARVIRRHAQARQVLEVGSSLVAMIQEGIDPSEAAARSLAALDLIAARDDAAKVPQRLSEAVAHWLDEYEARIRGDAEVAGIKTGWLDLDGILAGMRAGQLIVIGARPGMGKSDMAVGLAHHAGLAGVGSLVVSVEMSTGELTERFLASGVNLHRDSVRKAEFTDAGWQRISSFVGNDLPIYVLDDQNVTLSTLASNFRMLKDHAPEGIGLVIVDYLQLVRGATRSENRQVEVAELSRGLKRFARDAEVPVVALSSLSRNVEQRGDKRPQLADLRESGSLEADANVVLLLYRDEVYDKKSPQRGICEVNVAKQRSGATGVVKLRYDDRTGRFSDIPREEVNEPLSMGFQG